MKKIIIEPLDKTQEEYEKEWSKEGIGAKDYSVGKIEQLGNNIKCLECNKNATIFKYYCTKHFKDNRPLTDETLEELGFKKVFNTEGKYHTTYWRLAILKDIMLETYEVKSDKEAGETAWLKTPSQVPQTHYKTVGSVKMLIEALEGDE